MFVELKNEKIHYTEKGEGIPFIMLHGNMTSSVHLDVMYEHLPKGIRLITPDMRGFGQSSYNNRFDSLKELACDMIEFIDKLGIEKCIVGGWSTGGGVAMEMVALRPELFEKLVLVESVGITGYPILKKDENFQPIIGNHLQTKEEIASDPVQVLPILNAYKNKDFNTLKHMWNTLIYNNGNYPDDERYDKYLNDMITQRNLIDVDYSLASFNMSDTFNGVTDGSGDYKKIDVPVLVLYGDTDLVIPQFMYDSIVNNIKNCEVLSGKWGHSPFIDQGEFVCNNIYNFVSKK